MAPLLPGHGERYPGMTSCRTETWLTALRLTFESLHRDGRPVALLGYCLGGTLALAAARELNPRAVVCLSTPIHRLRQTLFPPTEGERDDLLSTEPFITDCQSETARKWRTAGCHKTVTSRFLQTFQETIEVARDQLAEVRCPLAMVQGRLGRVVGTEHAEYIAAHAGQADCTVLDIARAGHAVPIDHGRREMARQVVEFLAQIESSEKSVF
jgi:carboxylesterase